MFICLEGIDGCGKTTAQQLVKRVIEGMGHEVVMTSDTQGTPLGQLVRESFLSDQFELSATQSLIFLTAARLQNIHQVIIPALKANKVVICDRFLDSTFAYQVKGGGLDLEFFKMVAVDPLPVQPDLTLFLDISYEVSQKRTGSRGQQDKMERKSKDFFSKVIDGYHERLSLPGRVMVNAEMKMDEVEAAITSILLERIPHPRPAIKKFEQSLSL